MDDDALGNELLASDKDRREHALVVDAICENLRPLTSRLDAADEPELKKMASVQHLSTLIDATLNADVGLLDVIEAIHPTPAVGGVPTHEAILLIDELESIDRGWYTGGVGWIDTEGDGAVALALRCGLVRGTTTHLFAGAGIVEGLPARRRAPGNPSQTRTTPEDPHSDIDLSIRDIVSGYPSRSCSPVETDDWD